MPDSKAPSSPIFQSLDRCDPTPYTPGEYLRRALWLLVQASLIRLPIPRAFAWRNFWLRRFGAKIGHDTGIARTVRITHPWLLEMGNWSMIGDRAIVYNLGKITVGNHTVISQGTHLCAGTHDYTDPSLPLRRPEIKIGSGVWIAADSFVGPGVVIGDNSVIGARSVVVGEIPAGVVAAGNPCRVIKPRPMNA